MLRSPCHGRRRKTVKYTATVNERKFEIIVETLEEKIAVHLDGHPIPVDCRRVGGTDRYSLLLGSASHDLIIHGHTGSYQVHFSGRIYPVTVRSQKERPEPVAPKKSLPLDVIEVRAPMPGMVSEIEVRTGEAVTTGTGLAIIEAMKMENELKSPVNGCVKEIRVRKGDTVEKDVVLVVIDTTCP
jgi:biotin carboxyl carrier protein